MKMSKSLDFLYNPIVMCGRYTLTATKAKIAEEFGIRQEAMKEFQPSYNIAPSQFVPAVFQQGAEQKFDMFRWGYIPPWSRPDILLNGLINARKESIVEKISFKDSFQYRRCLIPSSGFYEWKVEGKRKIPYYICLKNHSVFSFAGLYSKWVSPDGHEMLTCAIITGEPNDLIQPIHQRMPIILPKDARNRWLDPVGYSKETLLKLLTPYSADEMEAYPVSRFVNSPENNTAECIRPASIS